MTIEEMEAKILEWKQDFYLNEEHEALLDDVLCALREKSPQNLREIMEAEKHGLLTIMPCKVGDTVWFVVKERLPMLLPGVYQGKITEIKAVQRVHGTLYLAVIEYEYQDPWYDGQFKTSEIHCSYTEYGSWVRFYTSPDEAALAMKGETKNAQRNAVENTSDPE